ncbi:MAG: hypothetical protein C0445_07460 [Polaromonas sp.]|nr:hypothetical protein [Polaromonas sp.]
MNTRLLALLACSLALPALAKLPAPSDEAKAKAAEAAAKTAHGGKVDAYKNCKAMDKAAAHYFKSAAAAKKDVKPAVATPACVDPGPFVAAVPAAPAAPAVAAPAPAAPAVKEPAKKS